MEKIVIATVLLSLLSGQAFAAPAPARYYAGAKIGINSVQGAKTNALGVLGGYRVGPDFALEAAYINLGSAEDGVSNGTVKLSVIEFGGVALFPITGQVSFLGKLGIAKTSASGLGIPSVSQLVPTYGFGGQYDFPFVNVRFIWDHYIVGDGIILNKGSSNLYSVSGHIKF